ncbi:hypothetical protein JOQ06_028892 [Pogonophryne albipinna]|uniref:Uncharacterized protein n=1 Tax=Pogonophryne albipinna TaxID=1090488 RepID=A0AAD6BAY9_9TELE|nr:hypothetical protein JOQ06_028892 [Pogonophryne albipinna]
MDQSSRSFLQKDLKVLNEREEKELQRKLELLDKQHRFTLRILQKRREALMKEKRRVVMVKICEPKATGNIAMREIRAQTYATTQQVKKRKRSSRGLFQLL